MSQYPDRRRPAARDSDLQTPLRRGTGRIPTLRSAGSGRGDAVRNVGSGRVARTASQGEGSSQSEQSKTSLLETPGGTVEIHNGEFNAVGGHHISVTINTGGDGAHSSSANSTPTVPPITGESFVQESGPRLARRPPTPPAQRSSDIYYRHMGTQRRGSPLWIPEPNKNLPLGYQRDGVTIGDVGIITAFGSFAFLFSICLPHDHPIQPAELPENFEPFYIAQSDIEKQSEFKNDSYLASASIERTHRDGDSSGLIFESSASEGAILAMPVGSNSEDLGNVIRLRRYVAKHAASWYKYIYDVRGREVLNGDVRLIIGHDKTKAWGMATFANRTAQENAFRLKFMPVQQNNVGRTYGWEYSGMAHVRAGPDTREIEALRANDPSEDGIEYENQCLFIRTLNVTLVDKVWRELASELDIQLDLDVHSSTSPSSSILGLPGSGNPSNNSSTFTSPSYGGFPSTSKLAENIVVQATPAVHPAMAGHPSKAINEMLLKHSLASVQLAITEDKDWISVLSHDDLVLPSTEDLCARVRASSDIVEEAGVIFLKPKGTQHSLTKLPDKVGYKPFHRPPFAPSTPASLMKFHSTPLVAASSDLTSIPERSLLETADLHLLSIPNPGVPAKDIATRFLAKGTREFVGRMKKPLRPVKKITGSYLSPASGSVDWDTGGITPGPPLYSSRTSSKAAEQKRRDSLKTSFDELRGLLPPTPVPSDVEADSSSLRATEPLALVANAGGRPNEGVSKLQLLHGATGYIKLLKGRVENRDDEIARLRQEVRRLRLVLEEQDGMDTREQGYEDVDLEKDLDAVEKNDPSGSLWALDEGYVGVGDEPMDVIVEGGQYLEGQV